MSQMMADPEKYFGGFVPHRSELLKALEEEAAREQIPIIGPLVGALLSLLVKAVRAKTVLELGCATGYSGIFIADALSGHPDGRLTTLEMSDDLIRRAQKNFTAAGVADRVTIVKGDCRATMADLKPGFDLVFMDIDKQYYEDALPQCHRLLAPGGLLVVDNTAFSDAEAFNRMIFSDPCWQSVNLLCHLPGHSPERDGICLALKV